jgi:hypothetical protein
MAAGHKRNDQGNIGGSVWCRRNTGFGTTLATSRTRNRPTNRSEESMNGHIPHDRLAGFTVIELMVALTIGLLLTGIVFARAEPAREAAAVRSARQGLVTLHARARATSVERAQRVLWAVDPVGDSAWIQRGTERIETIRFGSQLGVDVVAKQGIVLCMTPRGIANPDCGTVRSVVDIEFKRGRSISRVTLLPLGQLIEP